MFKSVSRCLISPSKTAFMFCQRCSNMLLSKMLDHCLSKQTLKWRIKWTLTFLLACCFMFWSVFIHKVQPWQTPPDKTFSGEKSIKWSDHWPFQPITNILLPGYAGSRGVQHCFYSTSQDMQGKTWKVTVFCVINMIYLEISIHLYEISYST